MPVRRVDRVQPGSNARGTGITVGATSTRVEDDARAIGRRRASASASAAVTARAFGITLAT
jgi:hypothetical protein